MLLLAGCSEPAPLPGTNGEGSDTAAGSPSEDAYERYPLRVGERAIQVELATQPETQRRGLMFRESLPENAGMLFVFPGPKQQSFWMKNTRIPLDIGFFSPDGRLREIYTMYPGDLSSTVSYRPDIQFALEMNEGWFARNDVRVGDHLSLEDLRAGLRAAGDDPGRFGV
ncbi:MAG: DUF192 domain-containing protein [Opitutales bacterium]